MAVSFIHAAHVAVEGPNHWTTGYSELGKHISWPEFVFGETGTYDARENFSFDNSIFWTLPPQKTKKQKNPQNYLNVFLAAVL